MIGGLETTGQQPSPVVPAGPSPRKPDVHVWRLETAPRMYRELTACGSGWVVLVPAAMPDFIPPRWWLTTVEEYTLPNGDRVLVGD